MNNAISVLRHLSVAVVLAVVAGTATAKLPVPPETPESKAKAEEAAAKAEAVKKKTAEDLAQAIERAVANYQQGQSAKGGQAVK